MEIKLMTNIREFFWPKLEIPQSRTQALRTSFEIKLEKNEDINEIYELVKKTIEDEESRIKTIETKSIVFVGSVGLSLSIFSLMSKDILVEAFNNNILIFIGIVITFTFLLLYIIKVGWFCIKALETRAYHRIDPTSYIGDALLDKKKIIADMLANIERNKNVINSKADMMIMSQAFYKRILVAIPVFATLIILSLILKSNNNSYDINNSYNTIINKKIDNSDTLIINSAPHNKELNKPK